MDREIERMKERKKDSQTDKKGVKKFQQKKKEERSLNQFLISFSGLLIVLRPTKFLLTVEPSWAELLSWFRCRLAELATPKKKKKKKFDCLRSNHGKGNSKNEILLMVRRFVNSTVPQAINIIFYELQSFWGDLLGASYLAITPCGKVTLGKLHLAFISG